METKLNLEKILAEVGPKIGEQAAERDETDGFIGPNYDILKPHKIFSALVPRAYGGGGVSHSDMCEFIRGLAHHCPSTALVAPAEPCWTR